MLSKLDPVTSIPAPPSQLIVYCLCTAFGEILLNPNLIYMSINEFNFNTCYIKKKCLYIPVSLKDNHV